MTPWTVARLAPLSMGFPRQEYRCEFPSPADLPHPGMESESPALAGRFFTAEPLVQDSETEINLQFKYKEKNTRDQFQREDIHLSAESKSSFAM